MRAAASALTETERADSDRALFQRFLCLPSVRQAGTLLLFYGVGQEPATEALFAPLWRQGKRICLPRCLPHRQMEARMVESPEDLTPGVWGIPEPGEHCPKVGREALDLILAPALCYDRRCRRLGQGGGYYDRYLQNFRGVTVGLCRDRLLAEQIPVEPHDLSVDLVLTETDMFRRPVR